MRIARALDSHRPHRRESIVFALDDLAASIGRRRRPGNHQDPIRAFSSYPVAKFDLDRRPRDHYVLDGDAQVGGEFGGGERRGF